MRAPDFWRRDGAAAHLLAPVSGLVVAAGWWRQWRARPHRLPVPVICIGNIVAGGAGKTPVALAVAARLQSLGRQPHFLTRGYGGRLAGPVQVDPGLHRAEDCGDEPLLLARQAPCWVARDRVAGGLAAVAAGADCLILDDGFQNPSLVKDLSLVVVDGPAGFGNGRVLPAGPLREPVARGLARAQALVILGPDLQQIGDRGGALPLLRGSLVPRAGAADWQGQRLLAFAGIGRPEKFFTSLRELGADLVETVGFPDHHPYNPGEIVALQQRAAAQGAQLVTTEKDFVRLPLLPSAPSSSDGKAVLVLPVAVQWGDDCAGLDDVLKEVVQ